MIYVTRCLPTSRSKSICSAWCGTGLPAHAAVAHLDREVHEGYIVQPFPNGTHIIAMDGRFFVEAAYGPPAPATSYICRERTRAERIEFLHARDRPPWSTRPVASDDPDPPPEPAPSISIGRHRAAKAKQARPHGPTSLTPEQIEKAIAMRAITPNCR